MEPPQSQSLSRHCNRATSFLFIAVLHFAFIFPLSAQTKNPVPLAELGQKSEPGLDVATVKPASPSSQGWKMEFTPNGFVARNVSLQMLLQEAWNAYATGRLTGGPPWLDKDHFDVEAKLNADQYPKFAELSLEKRRQMLQRLLEERFHVALHQERREVMTLALIVAKGGPKLKSTRSSNSYHGKIADLDSLVKRSGPGLVEGSNFTTPQLAQLLQNYTGHIVSDRTRLSGRYDFTLHWSPEELSEQPLVDASGLSLFAALREQLGLKLEPVKTMTDVIVVDRAERPDEN